MDRVKRCLELPYNITALVSTCSSNGADNSKTLAMNSISTISRTSKISVELQVTVHMQFNGEWVVGVDYSINAA